MSGDLHVFNIGIRRVNRSFPFFSSIPEKYIYNNGEKNDAEVTSTLSS